MKHTLLLIVVLLFSCGGGKSSVHFQQVNSIVNDSTVETDEQKQKNKLKEKGVSFLENEQVINDLRNAVSKIAKKHRISESEVIELGIESALMSGPLSEISSRMINNKAYIVKDAKRNLIRIHDRDWLGDSRDKTELAVVIDEAIIGISVKENFKNIKFFLFNKDNIHVFDWSELTGARIDRSY